MFRERGRDSNAAPHSTLTPNIQKRPHKTNAPDAVVQHPESRPGCYDTFFLPQNILLPAEYANMLS